MKTFRIDPHPDVELQIPRKPIEYFLTPPPLGTVNPGLIFTIPAYGAIGNDVYHSEKLNPYLASKYSSYVVSINYHGIVRSGDLEGPAPSILSIARHVYGYQGNSIDEFLGSLQRAGITQAAADFKLAFRQKWPEYISFGFLPALDHISVLADLFKRLEFNQSKIILFGSSYGGYIANLVAKYLPNTLLATIDNAGFANAKASEICPIQISDAAFYYPIGSNGLRIPFTFEHPWQIESDIKAQYFSDACRVIRNLALSQHWKKSNCQHIAYHSLDDKVVPIVEKDAMIAALQGRRPTTYRRIDASMVDGRLFKNLEHGMDASLRLLFDDAWQHIQFHEDRKQNDFSENRQYLFDCGLKKYAFTYRSDYTFSVEIEDSISDIELNNP